MGNNEEWIILKADIEDVKAKLDQIGQKTANTGTSMTSSILPSLGKIASAMGVAFSVKAVIDFAKQSIKAFTESEAAAASLANTISNLGGSKQMADQLQGMVDSMEQLSGFDDADISVAFRELYTQTGSAEKATQALNVAMNMAAKEHTSVATAATTVHNVMLGLSRTMKNYGMVTREGATDMDYLRELGSKMAGGLATNLDTLDGRLRLTTNSFDNLKEAIGATLAASVTAGGGMIANLLNSLASQINIDAEMGKLFGTALFDKERLLMSQLGATMGKAWLESYVATIQGKTQEHDVGWAASIAPPSTTATGDTSATAFDAGLAADLKIYNLTHTASANKLHDVDLEAEKMKTNGVTAVKIAEYVKAAKAAIYKEDATNAEKAADKAADAFKTAWDTIKIEGINVPDLAKFIGNLGAAKISIIKKAVAKTTANPEAGLLGYEGITTSNTPTVKTKPAGETATKPNIPVVQPAVQKVETKSTVQVAITVEGLKPVNQLEIGNALSKYIQAHPGMLIPTIKVKPLPGTSIGEYTGSHGTGG